MKQISQSKVVGTEAAPAPLNLDLVLLPAVTDEVEDDEPEAFLCGGMTLDEKKTLVSSGGWSETVIWLSIQVQI